ncbi:MAG TPA: nuclear transport factor 2 family protein [Ramlibacter sp.]|uniref:nuclear transport factor 2 family protein n=1 Tax=Ramlibacter sp. TaxID=1917967 RepID=UPI002C72983F|nr:nuclear transport factor 2 family protein [Ramlibacter sp.]HVZ44208.1 nuclear transport factor 2 family protein [Ramlibacter sp.]
MLSTKEIGATVRERFEAYQSGDAAKVMALYTDDVGYWDTSCAERIRGRAAVGKQVSELLGRYDLQFALLEEHRLEGRDAAIVLWEAAVRRRDGSQAPGRRLVMLRGMSILEVKGDSICRDEAYIDLASLDRQFEEGNRPC